MRRSLRDNESIPIPLEWNIMKFVAQIDKRRRKQFGYVDPPAQTGRGRGRKKVQNFTKYLRKYSTFRVWLWSVAHRQRNARHQRKRRNQSQTVTWRILSLQMISRPRKFSLIQKATRKLQRVSHFRTFISVTTLAVLFHQYALYRNGGRVRVGSRRWRYSRAFWEWTGRGSRVGGPDENGRTKSAKSYAGKLSSFL